MHCIYESKTCVREQKLNSGEEIESFTPPLSTSTSQASSHLCDPRECVCHRIVVNVSRSKLKWIQVYERSSTLHLNTHPPSPPTGHQAGSQQRKPIFVRPRTCENHRKPPRWQEHQDMVDREGLTFNWIHLQLRHQPPKSVVAGNFRFVSLKLRRAGRAGAHCWLDHNYLSLPPIPPPVLPFGQFGSAHQVGRQLWMTNHWVTSTFSKTIKTEINCPMLPTPSYCPSHLYVRFCSTLNTI